MVNRILTAAGFIKNKTYKETRFLKPPAGTYAIYMDNVDRWGSDSSNLVSEHEYTIELYSDTPDPGAEYKIENAFNTEGVPYTKQARYWIQEEQLYQTIYEFTTITKG